MDLQTLSAEKQLVVQDALAQGYTLQHEDGYVDVSKPRRWVGIRIYPTGNAKCLAVLSQDERAAKSMRSADVWRDHLRLKKKKA